MDQESKKKMLQNAFALLKSQGNNSADGVFQFLRERNLLDEGTEKIAKTALSEVGDPKNIDFGKFTQVCESVAKEKGFDLGNISKKILGSLFRGRSGKSGEASTSAHENDEGEDHGSEEDEDHGSEDHEDHDYHSSDDHDSEED